MYILSYWFVYCTCIAVWNQELVSFLIVHKKILQIVHLSDFCSYVLTKLTDPAKNKTTNDRSEESMVTLFVLFCTIPELFS